MDPLSHAALGRSLAAIATKAGPIRGTVAACVFGALSPDLDAVVMPFGWDRYLRAHEIGTHTVFGTLACAAVTAALVRAFARESGWKALAMSAWLGAASHVLLDLLSSARIRVFWPLFDRQFSIPLVAMADPWLAGLLAAAIPAMWFVPVRRQQIAAGVLCAAVAFLGVKSVFAWQAITVYRRAAAPHTASARYIVQASWASLNEWHIFDRTDSQVRTWRVAAGGGPPTLLLDWPVAAESELVRTSRDLSSVRNFLRAHDMAFAVTLPDAGNGHLVLWSDIRFCWNATGETADVEPTVVSGTRLIACALWVGGAFDSDGRPVRQMVKILGFTQRRAPGA
jgi:membrane-bound metal-dependent hydrolase YbcI (DUF457 family)